MSEPSGSSRSFVVAIAALVVALAAGGVAVWALLKEPPEPPQSTSVFTGTTTDDPKASVCDAFNVVRNGVQINTNLQPPGGPEDVTGSLAVAANARVALYDGGQYLLARLQPDTPPELADAVREFANHLMDIGARSTSGIPNTDADQAARLKEADAANNRITNLCK
ncbi:hypothetical protein ABQF17_12275 [Mycolicibacterium elephantis]|uniref:hypothetical protein n=1 Tax=Mycolicibacterium elephantis TaxID=81858 RepID=UPI0007EABA07|nr:hypothetical protein [Mycolicibacterium elephantis]OBA86349.1 hypothetical protein A5633_11000 [Mycolicibacterium elephantis]OBB26374.1 hypothetical protein A5762_08910 [Mycolicibacterium elephantis]OBE97864.1 hypothetical protein A5776_15820 [Mycolicibacterium elephantis]